VFNERTGTPFNRLQYPTDVVCLVVFWRWRYKLSLRDLAEMFLQRGILLTHETVRAWECKLAPLLSDTLRKRRHGVANRVIILFPLVGNKADLTTRRNPIDLNTVDLFH
jgi:transposase-like protein